MVWVTRVLEVLLNIVTNGFLIASLFVLTLFLICNTILFGGLGMVCILLFLTCSTIVYGGLSIIIMRSIYRRLFDKGGKNDSI